MDLVLWKAIASAILFKSHTLSFRLSLFLYLDLFFYSLTRCLSRTRHTLSTKISMLNQNEIRYHQLWLDEWLSIFQCTHIKCFLVVLFSNDANAETNWYACLLALLFETLQFPFHVISSCGWCFFSLLLFLLLLLSHAIYIDAVAFRVQHIPLKCKPTANVWLIVSLKVS